MTEVEFRTVAHGKNTIMVAFIIIIIVIILSFIQPHVIYHKQNTQMDFPVVLPGGEEPACQHMRPKRRGFYPWVLKILEEGMATPSSILAWRIPWTEEPGGLQSTESQRVRHNEWLSTRRMCTLRKCLQGTHSLRGALPSLKSRCGRSELHYFSCFKIYLLFFSINTCTLEKK